MALILNIETATTNCSVSVAKNGETLAIREHDTPNYSHSEQLHVFMGEVLERASLTLTDLDAIAVSKGPGSYTGLRIGVSAAKGLCFSLDLPLISIPTLESMAHQAMGRKVAYIIPVLDARRMEVYSAVFDPNGIPLRATKAEIIDETTFGAFWKNEKTLLLGSGAGKCKPLLTGPNVVFDTSVVPSAREMAKLSWAKFQSNTFEDIAYFEPYYLKDFVLAKPNKKS